MVTLTETDVLAVARQRHIERNQRILTAANGYCEVNGLVMALHEIGQIWRDEAAEVEQARKRAWKGTSDALRDAATRVIAVAQGLEKYGSELGRTTAATDTVPVPVPTPLESLTLPKPPTVTPEEAASEFLQEMGQCGAIERISGALCSKPPHDVTTNHHGNGITWPPDSEEREPEADAEKPTSGAPSLETASAAIIARVKTAEPPTTPEPPGDAVTTFTIGAADAAPAWAAEPMLTPVPLLAPAVKPLPDHLSASSLDLLVSCPLKWCLHYLHGVPRRPGWAMIGGNALHAVIKELEMVPSLREGLDADGARMLFSNALASEVTRIQADSVFPINTWAAAAGGKEDRAWWEADGPEMVHRYLEWRTKWYMAGWELLLIPGRGHVVEMEFLHHLDGAMGVPLKGFIDSAWVRPATGDIAIVDCKSGKSLPNDHFQLAIYAAAVRGMLERAGAPLSNGRMLGTFWSARDGAHTDLVDLDVRCPADELAYRVNMGIRQIASGAFMPNPSANYGGCGSCDAKLSCPVGSRRNAGKVSLPLAAPAA